MNSSNTGINLRNEAVNARWSEDIAPLLENMEKRELWIPDERGDLDKKLVEWADRLEAETDLDFIRSHDSDLLKILAFVRLRKSIALLQQLDGRIPGIPVELLYHSDRLLTMHDSSESDGQPEEAIDSKAAKAARIFRDRIFGLFRAEIIKRIFSSTRCKQIKEASREVQEMCS